MQGGVHRVELRGMPVGYSVESVRIGSADVTTRSLTVTGSPVDDVTITVRAPMELPTLRGRDGARDAPGARVEVTGPVTGSLQAPIQADGSFAVGPMPPGLYRVRLADRTDMTPVAVVVDRRGGEVSIPVPR